VRGRGKARGKPPWRRLLTGVEVVTTFDKLASSLLALQHSASLASS